MENQTLYSRHILLFSFQWRPTGAADQGSTRSHLPLALEAIKAAGHWQRQPGDRSSSVQAYSEHNYLHDFAHGAAFDSGEHTSVYNFLYPQKLPVELAVRNIALPDALRTPEPSKSRVFNLVMFMARLNIYETGVGVLSLFIDNFEQRSPEEVLVINDIIRRLYPARLHYKTGVDDIKNDGLLADHLRVGIWKEDFQAFAAVAEKPVIPAYFLPDYILGLLGPNFQANPAEAKQGDIIIQHVLDDRMFLLCLLVDEAKARQLSGSQPGETPYLDDAFWYSFVFVDRDTPQVRNKGLMRSLLEGATYPRWTEDGTLYGICRYALVVLTDKGFIVKTPITGNYMRLTELCLVQRASVLRFREEASAIAALIASGDRSREVASRIRAVYGDYIRFVNRFHFAEVTAVEQGIELYDLLRKQMRVQEQVDSLRTELEEMHSYAGLLHEEARLLQERERNEVLRLQEEVRLSQERERNETLRLHEETRNHTLYVLTVVSAAFLLPSLVLAYFDISDDWKRPLGIMPGVFAGFLVSGGALAAWLAYSRWLQERGWRLGLGLVLIAVYVWMLFVLPHLVEWRWL